VIDILGSTVGAKQEQIVIRIRSVANNCDFMIVNLLFLKNGAMSSAHNSNFRVLKNGVLY